eukprot:gene9108-biopygen18183
MQSAGRSSSKHGSRGNSAVGGLPESTNRTNGKNCPRTCPQHSAKPIQDRQHVMGPGAHTMDSDPRSPTPPPIRSEYSRCPIKSPLAESRPWRLPGRNGRRRVWSASLSSNIYRAGCVRGAPAAISPRVPTTALQLVHSPAAGSQPCSWFTALQLVHSPAAGSQPCSWFTALQLVRSPTAGSQPNSWFTALQLVHSPTAGSQPCSWFTALQLVHNPTAGSQPCSWFTTLQLVHSP